MKNNSKLFNKYVHRDGGTWKIINDDFLNANIPSESVHAVITSPPYNVGINYLNYDDNKSRKDYTTFCERVIERLYSVLAPSGRVFINLPIYNFQEDTCPVQASFASICEKAGFLYKGAIIWNKRQASKRTAWGSYCSAISPNIIMTEEIVHIFYKGEWKRTQTGESTIRSIEFIEYSLSPWYINGCNDCKNHPAPFPFELPYRLIQYFTFTGDTILDPFAGRGTTVAAAAYLGRHGIGVEISKEYSEYAKTYVQRILRDR